MLNLARARFVKEPLVRGEPILELMEMTLKNLSDEGTIDYADFLDRVDILSSLGKTVLISNYGEHHRLATYLFRHTKKMIGLVMGVGTSGKFSRRSITPISRAASSNHLDDCSKRPQAIRLSAARPGQRPAHHGGQPARLRICARSTNTYVRTTESRACAAWMKPACRSFRERCLPKCARAMRAGNSWCRRR